MTLFSEVLTLTLTPVSVIAVMAYLSRQYLELQVTKDLEIFKKQLDRSLFEHQTRFSLIHQKQAEVIGTLYGNICRTASRLAEMIHIYQPGGVNLPERKQNFVTLAREMQDYYNEHRIYLNDDICTKVDEIVSVIHTVWISFDFAENSQEYAPDKTGEWLKAEREMKAKWPPLKDQLEKEFRALLGVKAPGGDG